MATRKKQAAKKSARRRPSDKLTPKSVAATRRAAEILWDAAETPHRLIQEVHELMLLRCLKEANGNYAAAAEKFGPSRQSVQQYANSPLRDARWKPFQQNRRKTRANPAE
ncbi:MAG: hypothetical protein U1E65_07875 [Myxococcota bacterium]